MPSNSKRVRIIPLQLLLRLLNTNTSTEHLPQSRLTKRIIISRRRFPLALRIPTLNRDLWTLRCITITSIATVAQISLSSTCFEIELMAFAHRTCNLNTILLIVH